MKDERIQQASFAFIIWATWNFVAFWLFADGLLMVCAAALMCMAGLLSESQKRLPLLIAFPLWPLTIWLNVYSLLHVHWYNYKQASRFASGALVLVGAYCAFRVMKALIAAIGSSGKPAISQ